MATVLVSEFSFCQSLGSRSNHSHCGQRTAMMMMNPQSIFSRPSRALTVTRATNMDGRQAQVAQKLLSLEGELAFITQPGRIPPRAAVVAGLRKEISALRSELTSPGSVPSLDLTMPQAPTPQATTPTTPASASVSASVPSAGSKAAGREVKNASGARNALLAIEKKLGSQADATPLSEKAKAALAMVEGNVSSMREASKNLTEFESLQVENALLRTQLEVVMERKRHLSALTLALKRGLVGNAKKTEASRESTKKKKEEVVYVV